MRLKTILLSLSALVALNAGVAHASLIVNGDFEQTTNGTNKQLAAGTGTTATNYSTLVGWNSVSLSSFLDGSYKTGTNKDGGYNFVFNPSAPSSLAVSLYNTVKASPTGGNFFASDPAYGPGLLYQNLSGLVAGTQYSVTFNYALSQQNGYTGGNSDFWTVGLGTDASSYVTQDTSVLSISQGGFSGWKTASMTFTATAATEMLGFLAQTSAPGAPPFMLLDNVSFDAVKTVTGTVPEPTTLSLLLGGLGVAGLAARRRRNKRA